MEKSNKEILVEKTNKLIDDACVMMKGKIEKVCSCGAIDIDSYNGEFDLPTTILYALLMEAQLNYCWLTENQRKEAENIYYCI